MSSKFSICGKLPNRRTMIAAPGLLIARLASPQGRCNGNPSCDAELIALCGEALHINDQIYKVSATTVADEPFVDAYRRPFHEVQDQLFDLIFELKATTLEGFQARAALIVDFAPEFLECPEGHGEVLVMALLRDLLALRSGRQRDKAATGVAPPAPASADAAHCRNDYSGRLPITT